MSISTKWKNRWHATYGALSALALVVLIVFVASPEARQQFNKLFATIIYFGSSSGPAIRWGSANPSGACTPGSLYLQKKSGLDEGLVWFCPRTGTWSAVGSSRDVYDIRDFGAVCDGVTDDTLAIQGAIDAAFTFSNKAGEVRWAPTECAGKTLTLGPVTDPFQAGTDDPLSHEGVGLSFTAPRSATVVFTASPSTNISWTGSTITSADIGNYVFYGSADATYSTVFSETRVLQPTYGCTITAVLTSTTGTCVATTYLWQVGPALTTTSGSQSVYITNDHDFSIDDTVFNATTGATLDAGHVGKTMQFVVPMLPAYKKFDNTNRVGSHVTDERLTAAPCSSNPATTHWQCLTDENIKSKYFTATITAVTSATTGKMQINGLQGGSNWQAFFPDEPVHAGVSSICGGTDANCAAAASHQWGHLVSGALQLIGNNPHLDHYASPTWMSDLNELQNKHTYLATIFPYALPVNTEQRHITIRGTSMARSGYRFTGCPTTGQYDDFCAAMIFSKNKYFTWEDMYLVNGSGTSSDDMTQWGAYFGGLPGVGTQALAFNVNRVEINGFGVCWQFGDDNGAAASDFEMQTVASTRCGVGMRVTGQNTLDINIVDLLMGFNKIGFLNYAGNVSVTKGSASYNVIDFVSAGFGPFAIENFRTEGPSIHFVGGEPGLSLKSINIAEPQAARAISGDVIAAPSDTRSIAGVAIDDNDTGSPANSFYPITFGAGDITAADIRKIVLLPNVGASSSTCVAQIDTVTSSTTGTVFVSKSACIQSASTETITIYDTNFCDLTFDANELTPGDVGGQLALPDASVPTAWNRSVRATITEITSSTTGRCGFYLGNNGAGPVISGTTTDPSLFVNIGAYLDAGATESTFQNLRFGSAMVLMNPVGSHSVITMIGNQVWAPTPRPLTLLKTGPQWQLDFNATSFDLADFPTPTSNLSSNVGVLLPWTYVDNTNQGFGGDGQLNAFGNLGYLYGGPTPWALLDGVSNFSQNVDEQIQTIRRPGIIFDNVSYLNPFAQHQFPPTSNAAPSQQLSRVTQLSEAGFADGRNLRIQCTFATAATVTCPFERTEAIEVRLGVGSPTAYDPVTRTNAMNVTSGNFTQSDVGKLLVTDGCCGSTLDVDYQGHIVSITSPTVILVRQIPGGFSFPNGVSAVNATIGKEEPDAKYLPMLGGCTGLDLVVPEVVEVTSWNAAGVTLTSSKATSTATCRVLIVR